MELVNTLGVITLNETLFIELISFLIFLFLINRIMFRPLRATMQERRSYINGVQDEIKESENQLVSLNQQLKDNEMAIIQEANTQRDKLRDTGSEEAEEILESTRKEIQQIKTENLEFVNRQLDEARKSISEESEKLATRIMEKILDRRDFRA